MKTKTIIFALLLLISTSLFSQEKLKGNGFTSVIKNELEAFHKISIHNDFKITLIKSDTPAIEIETDENLHESINYSVTDSLFKIETSYKLKPKKTLNITLFCTNNLKEIELNEDTEIETLNTLNFTNIILKINDYAKANMSIKSDTLKLVNNNISKIQLRSKTKLNIESIVTDFTINGSSNTQAVVKSDLLNIALKDRASLSIEGNTNNLTATTKGSSDFKGSNLNAKKATIVTKDNTELAIQAFESINIEASNKSKIELYGNAKISLNKFTDTAKLYKKQHNSK